MTAQVVTYAFMSVLLVSIVSFVGIFTLSINEGRLRRILTVLVSLAAGALLGDAFLHLIPESSAELGEPSTGLMVLVGFLAFFIIEKILHWHHYHAEDECKEAEEHHQLDEHSKKKMNPAGYLILVSDGAHNILDGLIIGASFLASLEVGIATTIAVILHEIPQEIGDFGVLLHSGFSRMRALFLNFLSALLAFLGVAIALSFGTIGSSLTSWLIPVAAGGFIYISASDLVPELHKTKSPVSSLAQFAALVAGIAAMLILLLFEI